MNWEALGAAWAPVDQVDEIDRQPMIELRRFDH